MMRSRSGRDRRVDRARRRGIAIEDAVEHDGRGVAGEALAAGGHLVQHDAKREQVRARIQFLAARLLRRHVGDGAHGGADHAREVLGTRLVDRSGQAVAVRGGRELGQAEIEHLHLSAPGEEDVGRLDVAVEDALGMRRVEGIGHLHADVEQRAEVDGATGEAQVEWLAVEQLHGEIALAVLLVEAVDGADVGVVQGRRRASLAPEPFDGFGARGASGREYLDGHLAAELEVLRPIDHTHPAGAELIEDAVVPEGLTDEGTRHDLRALIVSGSCLDREGASRGSLNLKPVSI